MSRWRVAAGQVHRLERAAALLVEDVEALDHTDVVAHLGEGSVALATVVVHDIGRPADRSENQVAPAKAERLGRIARLEREVSRHGSKPFGDHFRIEAYHVVLHRSPSAGIEVARRRVQHLHPDLGQKAQRALVDRRHMVVAQHPDGVVGVADLPEGRLCRTARGAAHRTTGTRPASRHDRTPTGSTRSLPVRAKSRRGLMSPAGWPRARAVSWPR